jgi:hypothetical protein
MIRSLVVASLLTLSPALRADIATLTAVRDATLFNDAAGAIANGSGPVLIVGRAGGTSTAPIRRGVVRFDIASAVPAGATINSVQLVLANPSGNAGARTVELHRVLQDWGEGASNTTGGQGAPAAPGDATWLHTFFPNALWTNPGGDFDAAISTQQIVDALGVHTWPSTALAVSDVQGWLDQPASNFGWLLKLDVESVPQSTKVFGTREASDPGEHPTLVIDFDPPPVFTYCTPRTSSAGCTPSIGWSGAPSASAGSGFAITLSQTLNQKPGVFVYGLGGPAAQPFLGGTLCVAPPLRRSAFLWTAGNASGADCSGSLALDFNARIASGADPALVAGAVVHAQWLTRDPGNPAGSFNSSDAIRFAIAP